MIGGGKVVRGVGAGASRDVNMDLWMVGGPGKQ